MSDPIERFNWLADAYDEFTETMPNHEEMNRAILEVFRHYESGHSLQVIADLGCGTGTMARTLVDIFQPNICLALDGAEQMVKKTRKTFEDHDGPTRIQIRHEPFGEWRAQETYDLIYSSLAIHHLDDKDKWNLFERIHGGLKAGGLFLYADIFNPRPRWQELFKEIHWERRRVLGMSEEEIEQKWQSHKENDQPATVEDTLTGLEAAGFNAPEILWKNLNRAIIIAHP